MADSEEGITPAGGLPPPGVPHSPDVERWGRVKSAFLAALERPESQRAAFVARVCADDPVTRDEVLSLLESQEAAAGFGETPLLELLAERPSPGQELASRLEPGSRLGPYEITAFLRAGGMGEIYAARHTVLGRHAAIKTLRTGGSDPLAGRRLLREARHASVLSHPNVCKVYDVGEAEGTPYIAMELVDGRCLGDMLRESPLPLPDLLSTGMQIADALDHAHGHGIVHRDLKSSNVVVDSGGRPVVLDFGLARQTVRGPDGATETTLTHTGALAGTLSHMAPEVLLGGRADTRSDIWSLGVLLYEMATGELPFQGRTPFETSFGILNEGPRPMGGNVPLALRLVIERCLRKDPEARYQSAARVRDSLEAIHRRRAWPLAGRLLISAQQRTLYGAGAGTVLILALALGGPRFREAYGGAPGSRISTLALLHLENATGDPDADYYAEGLTEALTGQLGTIVDVRIISPGSAARAALAAPTRDAAARQLGADVVVEGRLRQARDRIAVDVWLTDPARGRVLWSDTYERSAGQVLALQADLIQGLATAVRLAVRPGAEDRLATVRAVNPEAYQAYLMARYEWNRRTTDSLRRAIVLLERAIEMDPTYAPAYAVLADCYNQFGTLMVGVGSPLEFRPKAAAAAIRALQIDPYSAEAHAALGYVLHYDWHWEEAEKEFLRAVELNPSYAPARLWYSNLLMSRGRLDEALEQVYAARDLDPFSLIVNTNVGWVLAAAGRHEEAIAQLERTLALDSTYVHARWRLVGSLIQTGRIQEAYHHARRVVELADGASPTFTLMAEAYAMLGETEEIRALADELLARSATEYVPPPALAGVFIHLGDLDNALEWTARAFEERANWIAYLDTSPEAGPLQKDPRFQALVATSGLR
jgi:eukaryotic-like serine/threonine-protein kinase